MPLGAAMPQFAMLLRGTLTGPAVRAFRSDRDVPSTQTGVLLVDVASLRAPVPTRVPLAHTAPVTAVAPLLDLSQELSPIRGLGGRVSRAIYEKVLERRMHALAAA